MHSETKVAQPSEDRRVSRRRGRFAAQRIVWAHTNLERVAFCGRVVTDRDAGVSLKVTGAGTDGAHAGFSGLQSCGSVWACPVCAEKVNAHRQLELEEGIERWTAAGHAVLFGTLTLRHNSGHRLDDLLAAISPAWNRTTSGAGVAWNGGKVRTRGKLKGTRRVGDKELFGIRGYVRLLEVKWGHDNGWHPHVHFLLFLDQELTSSARKDLASRLFGRWSAELANHGLSSLESVGIDLRPVTGSDVAGYFTKSAGSAAFEVTGSQSKVQGSASSYTPFEILRRVAVVEDQRGGLTSEKALRLWLAWERASKGRRQLTWSRGLRSLLGLDVELEDEEIVTQDEGGEVVDVIETDAWYAFRMAYWRCELLEAAERGVFSASFIAGLSPGAAPPGS